ncbi:hypothetical protein GH714_016949 [Hevea brasiliensis]|uniref:Disease resistance N-terminal domain-containing protein n=1 Tax=Hevea brasiliensis TaxID=3981 RepID=A0A6A6N0D3_HEVBR|nr:hypothetical protein GH714_016949 [Hevea brasiliensis]
MFWLLLRACKARNFGFECVRIKEFGAEKYTKHQTKVPKMAEAILFDIAGEIIMKLGSLALDEIGVCWGVNDELQKLKRTVSRIQAVLLDAEKKQALDEQVKDWLGKLQEVVYDADDLLDDFATEALQHKVMTGNR